ncbi:Napepld [Scenedesmus sp. PABB004]|nr:Napepld [Scenedesmus sp. PABB004]
MSFFLQRAGLLSNSLRAVLASALGVAVMGAGAVASTLPPHHLAQRPPLLGPRFDNPWPTWTGDKSLGDVLGLLREMRALGAPNWGYLAGNRRPSLADCSAAFPRVPPDAAALRAPPGGAVQALWVGHASLLVQLEGVSFMTDPFFSQRSSPLQFVGPQRAVQPALVPEDAAMPRLDFVLISHNHYDHLDSGSVERLHKRFGHDLAWYVPLGLKAWFTRRGITNVTELDWWQEAQHPGSKVRVTLTPAQHWSARGAFDRRATLWGGWAVVGEARRFWFAGDTGYCPVFPEIGERLGPFDLAAIPIGAYEPRGFMAPMHVGPEESVAIHREVRSRRSIGIHCCTFALTTAWSAMPREQQRRRGAPAAPREQRQALEAAAAAATAPSALSYAERVELSRTAAHELYLSAAASGVVERLTADASARAARGAAAPPPCGEPRLAPPPCDGAAAALAAPHGGRASGYVSNTTDADVLPRAARGGAAPPPEPPLAGLPRITLAAYHKRFPVDFMAAARPFAATTNQTLAALGAHGAADKQLAAALGARLPARALAAAMADLGPSVVDIERARVATQAAEQGEPAHAAAGLRGAHDAALRLEAELRAKKEAGAGEPPAAPRDHQGAPSFTEAVQGQQAALYAGAPPSRLGEAVKGTIAAADQATTTRLRDAAAGAAATADGAARATAEGAADVAAAAAGLLGAAKETGALGLGDAPPDAPGRGATAYEGAVFSSDDPEYTRAADGAGNASAADAPPAKALPRGAHDSAPAGEPGGAAASGGGARQPVIATPREHGVAAGDPAGQANVVAAATAGARGLLDALGLGGGAPATPLPDAPDPRTEGVAVGDMRGLKEALAATKDDGDARSDTVRAAADQGAPPPSGAGASLAEGAGAARDAAARGLDGARERVRAGLDAAGGALGGDAGGPAPGTAAAGGAGGGGLLSGLAQLVSGIATKASSSEELMAGGLVPDEAAGPAAAGGPTSAEPAPAARGAAGAAGDAAEALRERADAARDQASAAVDSAREGAAGAADAARDQASAAANRAREGAAGAADAARDQASAAANRAREGAAGAADAARDQASAAANRAREGAAGAADAVRDQASAAADRAREGAAGATDAVRDQASAAVDSAREGAAGTADAVRDKAGAAADSAREGVAGAAEAVRDQASAAVESVREAAKSAAHVAAGAMEVEGMRGGGDTVQEALRASRAAQAAYGSGGGSTRGADGASSSSLLDGLRLGRGGGGAQQQQLAAMAVYSSAGQTEGRQVTRRSARNPARPAVGPTPACAAAARRPQAPAPSPAREAGGTPTGGAPTGGAPTGGGGSLLRGAKEGFVGAYDAAAGAVSGAAGAVRRMAPGGGAAPAAPDQGGGAASRGPSAEDVVAAGAGAGTRGAGGGGSAQEAWRDVRHGGAKAPGAVSQGETAAPWDVTSNVERSKHLDDPAQAKIYEAETYRVSPGSQAPSGQAGSAAAKSGAVAGAQRAVTGGEPHDKPDTYRVDADQARSTRFSGDKGMASGFGTGSAAPWDGDDTIKTATAPFTRRGTLPPAGEPRAGGAGGARPGGPAPPGAEAPTGGSLAREGSLGLGAALSAGGQAELVEAAQAAAAAARGPDPDRASSNAEGAVAAWVGSMAAVWEGLGRAEAKGPKGKEFAAGLEDPNADVMVDPVPTGGASDDPHALRHKAERLGKAAVDTATTSDADAAADPDNLRGKSSDNKPDGTAFFLKHEAAEAAAGVAAAPAKAAAALGTAAEIGRGVAGHVAERAAALAGGGGLVDHGKHHRDAQASVERLAADAGAADDSGRPSQAAAAAAAMPGGGAFSGVSVGAGAAKDAQALQEARMGAIEAAGHTASSRDTLGDKVIGPLVSDPNAMQRAKELAASYKAYRAEHPAPSADSTGAEPTAAPAAASSSPSPSAGSGGAELPQGPLAHGGPGGGGGSGDEHKGSGEHEGDGGEREDGGQHKGSGGLGAWLHWGKGGRSAAGGGAKGEEEGTPASAAREAADTAAATGEAARMEGRAGADAVKRGAADASDAAARTAGKAAGRVEATAGRLADGVRDAAREARDTAAAAGEVVGMEADAGASALKAAAGDVRERTGEAADAAGDAAQRGVDAAAHGAGEAVGRGEAALSEARKAAGRAGEEAGAVAGGVLASVGGAAKALLGGLLGPFEKEAAFDEATAVVTGLPDTFELVATEQMAGAEAAGAEASRAALAGAGDTGAAGAAAKGGAGEHGARRAGGAGQAAGAGGRGAAAAPAGSDAVDGTKARLQAGVDDAAHAAGLAAGHVESGVEGLLGQVSHVTEQLKDLAADWEVPPAEIPSSTEELLANKAAASQAAAAGQQGQE